MATMDEFQQLQKEIAAEREADKASLKEKISTLSKASVGDLLELKDHWIQERKANRKLDEATQRKRREAEIWLEAIDYLFSRPRAAGASTQQAGENLDLDQAAAYLNISTSTLYKWTSQNKIPHTTVGGKKLSFAKKDLDAFLEGNRRLTNEDLDREADLEVGKLRARRQKNPRKGT